MSGVNQPFRATPCARIGGAIRGGLFCGFATLGGAAISIARGEFVGAAKLCASMPAATLIGVAAGALGLAPSWRQE